MQISSLIPSELQYNVERIYVPILRGLRPTQVYDDNKFSQSKDNYLQRTKRDYFVTINDESVFTGLRLYDDTKRMLLGAKEGRLKIKLFEEFLSSVFFNSEPVNLIPNINDDSLHISIGSEERPIYELGDGIQSIIILLYPLFFNQGKNLMFFVEEPENSMHPGLQRLFLDTLMREEFKSFQYFISTHSNHFLDITMDLRQVSVYTFDKIKNTESENFSYSIKNVSNENLKILDLIGVRNSSLFLSNFTIWVEGITDRLYIKKYLDVYQNFLEKNNKLKTRFKEDYNFSFIEYSGGNIVHCSFDDEPDEDEKIWEKIKAKKISSKIFLIADKDNTDNQPDSAKAKRLAILKEQLGHNFKVLNGTEIENLIKPEILIQTIKLMEGENSNSIKFDKMSITEEKYRYTRMGLFIENEFKGLKRKYNAKSNTIYPKLEFCRTAINLVTTVDDLSTEGLRLVEEILSFIANNN